MSYEEFLSWVEYRRKYGPLNAIHRAHQESTLMTFRVCSALGAKMDLDKMFVYPRKEETEEVLEEASVETIAAMFKAFTPKDPNKYKRS